MTHDELKKNIRADIGETRDAHCPNCNKQTSQICTLLDPDNKEGHTVWTCDICYEEIEIES
jgi:transcription elongation factor Elf1